jgi:hypothetical protein
MQAAGAADAGAAVVAAMFGSGTGGKGLTTTEVIEVVTEGAEGAEGNEDVSSTPLKKKRTGRSAGSARFFARSPLNFGTTRLLKKYGQPVGLKAALKESVGTRRS